MIRVLVRPLLVALVLTWASHAGAQSARKPLTESLHGPAQDAYSSATLLFNNGDFAGALAKYKQAFDLSKDARLLFDMAICAKNLRAYARMQSLLVRFEAEEGSGISADDKQAVDDALAAVRNLVGKVLVVVSEAGASVALDGDVVGQTPLAAPLTLDLGAHRVIVSKAGFEPAERSMDVEGGTEETIAFSLVPRKPSAHVAIVADPDATISIDARIVGKGRYEGALPPGPHELMVAETGKQTYRKDIDLRDGETRTQEVTLRSEPHGALWPWIVGGAVAAAGAVVGGYFLFRPQDTTTPLPAGKLTQVTFNAWGRR